MKYKYQKIVYISRILLVYLNLKCESDFLSMITRCIVSSSPDKLGLYFM